MLGMSHPCQFSLCAGRIEIICLLTPWFYPLVCIVNFPLPKVISNYVLLFKASGKTDTICDLTTRQIQSTRPELWLVRYLPDMEAEEINYGLLSMNRSCIWLGGLIVKPVCKPLLK